MDVTCERCNTEYEFDDALVSERGTTVKCTSCGHQFKVRRLDGLSAPERWVVRTVDGRELEFGALRELQQAIAQSHVTREDVLSRAGTRPRRLGSIAELAPFFTPAGGISVPSNATGPSFAAPAIRGRSLTPVGLGAVMPILGRTEGSVAIPLPTPPARRALSSIPPPPRAPSIPPQVSPPVIAIPQAAPSIPEDLIATMPHAAPAAQIPAPAPKGARIPSIPPPHAPLPSVTPPPPRATAASERNSVPPAHTPTPAPARSSLSSLSDDAGDGDPHFASLAPSTSRPRGGARLMVTVVVVGLLAFGAVTFGRKLLPGGAVSAAASPANDERIATLLHAGERNLDEGDLETAKEQFVKASALAEREPRVAIALAHLAEIRADLQWLRVKLLGPGDTDEALAQRNLDDATLRLNQAVSVAAELAPSEGAVVRAKMASLRVTGHAEAARKLVADLASSSAQPETALALAALDLAEASPSWAPVVERLRVATSAEKGLGRAHAMLVYALARSGDTAGAKAELERLLASPRPHPLAKPLQSFVLGSPSNGAIDVSALPDPSAVPSDPAECMAQGLVARTKGDLARAELLFQAAVDKQPSDVNAATALAEAVRARGDGARAMKLYQAAVTKDDRHIPALIGLADLAWDTGDRARAMVLYKQVTERTSDRAYTARANQRLNPGGTPSAPSPGRQRASGPGDDGRVPDDYVYVPPDATARADTTESQPVQAPTTPTTAPTAPPPESPPTPAPPSAPPAVDTSDLPEHP
jgi:predicted Zn finger-like uncharacterized protein